jgi:hypothetical protein
MPPAVASPCPGVAVLPIAAACCWHCCGAAVAPLVMVLACRVSCGYRAVCCACDVERGVGATVPCGWRAVWLAGLDAGARLDLNASRSTSARDLPRPTASGGNPPARPALTWEKSATQKSPGPASAQQSHFTRHLKGTAEPHGWPCWCSC